jgi:predicted transcriptional regulator
MKTAISLPDAIFEDAERLAKRLGTSRSGLYARALTEFLARHSPAEVTAALDRAISEVGEEVRPFGATAARRVLEDTEW